MRIPWGGRRSWTADKAELKRFLELNFPGSPEGQLKLLVLDVLRRRREPRERTVQYARRWDLRPDQAEELLRGEVEPGFRWYSLEGVLSDCGAGPAELELARELFHEVSRAAPASTAETGPLAVTADQRPLSDATPEADATEPVEDAAPGPAVIAKPDPLKAADAKELIAMMGAYRVWAGRPSYRKMASVIGGHYAHSTLSGIHKRAKLPAIDLVTAYIKGCGGDPDDISAWREAWRRIAMEDERSAQSRPPG
jgi:hypothetical protein